MAATGPWAHLLGALGLQAARTLGLRWRLSLSKRAGGWGGWQKGLLWPLRGRRLIVFHLQLNTKTEVHRL